jgi:hypothetical protein
MDSVKAGESARTPGSRRHRCDHPFIGLLAEDYGIPPHVLQAAFIGVPSVPKSEAIALCEWAMRRGGGPDRAGEALRAWARKYGRGSYDPRLIDAPELTHEAAAHERAVEGRA